MPRADAKLRPDERPPTGHFSRSRSLEVFNHRLGPRALERGIESLGARAPRVLELGCGEGRVLMELAKLFPTAELHGVNKERWAAMRGSSSLRETALRYATFTREELRGRALPEIHFHDATTLRFADRSFDLVYSQVAIPHIAEKHRVLEEVWRVLRVGGRAILHVDAADDPGPDGRSLETPRWVLYDERQRRRSLRAQLSRAAARGFDLRLRRSKGFVYVMMHKRTARPLRLGLAFDAAASFDIKAATPELRSARGLHRITWGHYSVLRPEPRAR